MSERSKDPRKTEPWEHGIVFAAIVFVVIIVVVATATGCSPKWWQRWNIRDSVAVHYKDSTIFKDSLRIRDSLMYVPLPVEGSQNIFPTFIPSHLETSLAESDAWVDTLGLHHTIGNKKGEIGVHVPVTEHVIHEEHSSQKDSIRVEYVKVPVKVEKELTRWQKFQLKSWWWLVGIVGAFLTWLILKIIKLIKK